MSPATPSDAFHSCPGTVDAHTAHHLYHECLKGDLVSGRTVILISHHVGLCAPGAAFVVALDNGRVQFQGDYDSFLRSSVISGLTQSGSGETVHEDAQAHVEPGAAASDESASASNSGTGSAMRTTPPVEMKKEKKPARIFVEEEKRAVGRIKRDIWQTYFQVFGDRWYWALFIAVLVVAAAAPVVENKWLELRCSLLFPCECAVDEHLLDIGHGQCKLGIGRGAHFGISIYMLWWVSSSAHYVFSLLFQINTIGEITHSVKPNLGSPFDDQASSRQPFVGLCSVRLCCLPSDWTFSLIIDYHQDHGSIHASSVLYNRTSQVPTPHSASLHISVQASWKLSCSPIFASMILYASRPFPSLVIFL
jgi:hypothetical protein